MKNRVVVRMMIERGCDVADGEYSLEILQMIGSLHIEAVHKRISDDISLICEAVVEKIADLQQGEDRGGPIPKEGWIEFVLDETGEWDPHPIWHKYYEVVECEAVDLSASASMRGQG